MFEDRLSFCVTPDDIKTVFGAPSGLSLGSSTDAVLSHVFQGQFPLYNMHHFHSRTRTPQLSDRLAPATNLEPRTPKTPGSGDNNGGKADDFYVNVGDAIRTLRRELPTIFTEEITYNIYRDDVVFRDPKNTFMGIDKYKLIFKTLRFFGAIFFQPNTLWLDVLRIWQPKEDKIVVRWCVRGRPRAPWQAAGNYDGTSEFKLDSHGKIYEHKVNNITMSPDNYFSIFSRMLSFNVARAQTPTPSFFTLARGSRRSLQNTSEQLRLQITSCLRTRREVSTGV